MSTPINPQALFGLVQQKAEYKNSDSVYLKMSAGIHQIRFCPPWSTEATPARMVVNHSNYHDKDNNLRMPLCYQYAFTNQNIALALKSKGVIKAEDLKVYGQLGCVFCRISDALTKVGGKKQNKTFAKSRFLWNVVDRSDGKVKVWGTSGAILDTVTQAYGIFNNIFNVDNGFDWMINAQGEGIQRKYVISPIQNPCPLGVELSALHDLDQIMADGYKNVSEAYELIVSTYPQMIQLLNLNQMVAASPATF